MRVQIITKDNGLGLSHDHRVLRDAILKANPGAEVVFLDWQRPQDGKPSAINFFLELLNGEFLKQAGRNIYVPNPEWYYSHLWGSVMPRVNEIWAKTKDCERIFTALHGRVLYSGWTSDDIMDRSVERAMEMIHVAGGSTAKGTAQVLSACDGVPWTVTVVSREARAVPANVKLVLSPDDATLRRLQNRSLIHLCPSSYEGYGHYINEGKACGAFIITTNAPPMSELVRQSFGAAVGVIATTRQQLAVHHHVDRSELRAVMEQVAATPMAVLQAVGVKARESYVSSRASFHEFVANALNG